MTVAAEADWILDIGPEAADASGQIIAQAPPKNRQVQNLPHRPVSQDRPADLNFDDTARKPSLGIPNVFGWWVTLSMQQLIINEVTRQPAPLRQEVWPYLSFLDDE